MSEAAAIEVEDLRASMANRTGSRGTRCCRGSTGTAATSLPARPSWCWALPTRKSTRTSRRAATGPASSRCWPTGGWRSRSPRQPRVHSLTNTATNPKVALLFMVPGFDETVRVNGRATVTQEPALLESLAVQGKPAIAAIVVEVEEAFFHCAKAFVRSALWNPASRADRSQMPTLGGSSPTRSRASTRSGGRRRRDDIRHNLY